MSWYMQLEFCKQQLDFTYQEIADLTGTSHTQVRRWRDQKAQPTGPQKAIIKGIYEWGRDNGIGGKSYLVDCARRHGHYQFLKMVFCENTGQRQDIAA